MKMIHFIMYCTAGGHHEDTIRTVDNARSALSVIASLIDTENGGGGLPGRIRLYMRLRGLITDKLYVSCFEVQ